MTALEITSSEYKLFALNVGIDLKFDYLHVEVSRN